MCADIRQQGRRLPSTPRLSLDDPRYYFNRHLLWLAINHRVLEEAFDELLERVKFLAITVSNLDEFVEVRLAGLPLQAAGGKHPSVNQEQFRVGDIA